MQDDFKTGFLKTLWVIREYLPQVVIGGGWVPLIYYHYFQGDKSKNPLRTIDIDFFVPDNIPVIGSKTLDQLLTDAGLKSEFKSRDIPPIIHYKGKIDNFDVEIEFLTNQVGSREDKVIEVQKGLHAEALRYLSISLENVIAVKIDDFDNESKRYVFEVKVPAPAAFIFHKGLVFQRRKDKNKKAKDLHYIFDVLVNFSDNEDNIFNEFKQLKNRYKPWFDKFISNMEKYFSDMTSEGIQLVSEQRPITSFPRLTDDQFKFYAFGIFQRLIKNIKK
jgi:hypothetical protein